MALRLGEAAGHRIWRVNNNNHLVVSNKVTPVGIDFKDGADPVMSPKAAFIENLWRKFRSLETEQ